MSGRSHAIFASAILLLSAWWWFFARVSASPEGPAETVEAQAGAPAETTIDAAESQQQYAATDHDRQDDFANRVADQAKRTRAGAQTEDYRKALQMSRDADWLKLINPYRSTYKALRAKAAADPHGTTPCTICDGRGSLGSCFLCGSTGKCPTCKGTGHVSADEYCPTCFGTGKCYLCNGTGKMVCPFCDDGTIYSTAPPIPMQLPINY